MLLRSLKGAVALAVAVAQTASVAGLDDLSIYTDTALVAGWEDWSWSSTIDYDATDLFEGTSSISVTNQAWAALSLKLEGNFSDYAGLKFDIAVCPMNSFCPGNILTYNLGSFSRRSNILR